MAGREDYEERKERKLERCYEQQEKAVKSSDSAYRNAHNISEHIPMGQPILVGHHSEKNARRDANKIDNYMRKSVDEQSKANYYAEKAASIENNTAIYSDDPKCIEKLEEKISRLKKQQTDMKAINKYYRKNKTCIGCDSLTEEKAKELDDRMKTAYSWETAPFRSYELTSINNKIKEAQKRLTELTLLENTDAHEDYMFADGCVKENIEINRVQIFFDAIPEESIRGKLKQNGFRWARTEKAWQKLRQENTFDYTVRLIKSIYEKGK